MLTIAFWRILLVRSRPHVKYKMTVYPYITYSFNSSNPVWHRREVYPKLDLASHYLPLAWRLLWYIFFTSLGVRQLIFSSSQYYISRYTLSLCFSFDIHTVSRGAISYINYIGNLCGHFVYI